MKRFISQVRNLSQHAAELKAALEAAPAKVAEWRETVAGAADQFRQTRAEVQSAVHGLRAEGEDGLVESLREIDESVPVFRAAGYVVQDVEMELGIVQRLIVHLEKAEDQGADALRRLAAGEVNRRATHAILTALAKAEEFADRVDLRHLGYHKLTVYVGLAPSVRICWCLGHEEVPVEDAPPLCTPAASVPETSAFTQTSYFERRPVATSAPEPVVPVREPAALLTPAPTEPAAVAPVLPAGPVDPLARFKRMPDLSKLRR